MLNRLAVPRTYLSWLAEKWKFVGTFVRLYWNVLRLINSHWAQDKASVFTLCAQNQILSQQITGFPHREQIHSKHILCRSIPNILYGITFWASVINLGTCYDWNVHTCSKQLHLTWQNASKRVVTSWTSCCVKKESIDNNTVLLMSREVVKCDGLLADRELMTCLWLINLYTKN